MCTGAILLLLSVSSACASSPLGPETVTGLAARTLSDAHDDHSLDYEASDAPFIQLLGSESPLEHLLGLYAESRSTEDAVAWLFGSSRDGSSGAQAEEEDAHAGHGHRRLLDADPHVHDHSSSAEDEEQRSQEEEEQEQEEHALQDHDHGSHSTTPTVLDSASLVDLTRSANRTGDAERLEMAMGYIIACQADKNCELEAENFGEDEEARSVEKLWGLKIGLAFSFLVITVMAAYVPAVFKGMDSYSGILALFNTGSGAIFLTVGVVHLLPEVVEFEALAALDTDFPVGFALVVTGFVIILFVEHVCFAGHDHLHACRHDEPSCMVVDPDFSSSVDLQGIWKDVMGKYRAPMIMQLAILVHTTLESIALGLASPQRDVLLLFAAIAAHKGFDSMAISTRLFKRGCPPWLVTILLLPIYIVPFIGVLVGTAISSENYVVALVLNALTVGGFVYVGGFEVLCEEFTHDSHVRAELDKVRAELEQTKTSVEDVPALAPHTCNEQPWEPTKPCKFLAFIFGVGVIFIFSAVLPKHAH